MSVSKSMICKGCWQHMHLPTPIRGPFAIPFKMIGIRVSQMNPNLCTMCEKNFTSVKKKKQVVIPATILFADLRGYTNISQQSESHEILEMLHGFYDECASVVWERDGIINKFIGDALLAIFNFPIMRKDHVRQAVLAGMELQRRCKEKKISVTNSLGEETLIGVGVGIHTGETSIGEVGTAYKDFTAIGPVVNLASRMQGAASIGEVLVTEEVYEQVVDIFPGLETQTFHLKGIGQPVKAYVMPS